MLDSGVVKLYRLHELSRVRLMAWEYADGKRRASNNFWERFLWSLRAGCYMLKALWLSDKLERLSGGRQLMKTEWLLTRGMILAEAGRFEEAYLCTKDGIVRINEGDVQRETGALLFALLGVNPKTPSDEKSTAWGQVSDLVSWIETPAVKMDLWVSIAKIERALGMGEKVYSKHYLEAMRLAIMKGTPADVVRVRGQFPELQENKAA